MIGIDIIYVVMFFVAAGIALIFAAAWIANSESKRNILKNEINKMKLEIESHQRDKFMLEEKMEDLESAVSDGTRRTGIGRLKDAKILQLSEQNTALEKEARRLKAELAEARSSLEEVYKALS